MKTLILYHSKTGFTERYAKWLAEALQGDCVPFQNRRKIDLSTMIGWFSERAVMPGQSGNSNG